MVELLNDILVFSFEELHECALLHVSFHRTLRIPDDDRSYPLPPGLGHFPLRHVDDFGERSPQQWNRRGGIVLPMYQSEALWLKFWSPFDYPFAVKVATGKINALTGESWNEGLVRDPQDYMQIPVQPWLDGYYVRTGVIRQFVAMPLGSGYSVEEQITGAAEHGGIQLLVHPLKASAYRPQPKWVYGPLEEPPAASDHFVGGSSAEGLELGLAAGGYMAQEVYHDTQEFNDWDLEHRGRCFVHLANSLTWRAITGEDPPTVPFTSAEYANTGLPWFEYYADGEEALPGGHLLNTIRSVTQIGQQKGDVPLPENQSVAPEPVVKLRAGVQQNEVREGAL
ncbi:MAG: hypothetical protein ACRENP_19495 [Longimicrobiales bacterium]